MAVASRGGASPTPTATAYPPARRAVARWHAEGIALKPTDRGRSPCSAPKPARRRPLRAGPAGDKACERMIMTSNPPHPRVRPRVDSGEGNAGSHAISPMCGSLSLRASACRPIVSNRSGRSRCANKFRRVRNVRGLRVSGGRRGCRCGTGDRFDRMRRLIQRPVVGAASTAHRCPARTRRPRRRVRLRPPPTGVSGWLLT